MHESGPAKDIGPRVDWTRPLSAAFAAHKIIDHHDREELVYAEFVEHPDLLLRRESSYSGGPQSRATDFMDKIALGRSALCRLRDYGISVPSFNYVIAHSKELGQPCLYSVIEFVEGENITDIQHPGKSVLREVEGVFVKFLTYLRDARTSGKPFWTDFNIHQFMYGTVRRDREPRCYLVDIEPYVGRWPVVGCGREVFDRSYLMQLMRIYLDIEWFEGHSNRGIKMKRARALLLRSAHAVPDSPIYSEFRDNLLLLISRGRS